MRQDFPFFASFDQRRDRMADDVRIFAGLADSGDAAAAKDVSMAGLLGSLAMLLEARQAGAVVDLDSIPLPDGVALERWVVSFPAYAFLLCADPDRAEMCRAPFVARGLTCEQIGVVTDDGVLQIASHERSEAILRFPDQALTGLTPL
jgi:selenophosphate synthetase-related protein